MLLKFVADLSLLVDAETRLNLLREQDANALFALVDANRAHLKEFLNWVDACQTPSDMAVFIQREQAKFERLETLTFTIRLQGEIVGVVSLDRIDQENEYAKLGAWIAKKYEGKGIMLKSMRVLIQYAFQNFRLHRLEVRSALHCVRSQRLFERLGFIREGILKETIPHYGEYFDAYLYALFNDRPVR